MPQNERQRVWKGEIKKTSGGLTKAMLMKNSRGKIVSRKKSEAAKKNNENNLAGWLRKKGEKFLSKGVTAEHVVRKDKRKKKLQKLALPSSGTVPKKKLDSKKTVVVLPKPKPKAKPKPAAPKPKPKPKPKPAAPKPKPKPTGSGTSGPSRKRQQPKKKKKGPPVIVDQAPEKAGEVADTSKISVGNIIAAKEFSSKKEKWIRDAKILKHDLDFTLEEVVESNGPIPEGVSWDQI
jgi:outer membrane biosynthesis protein TonB